MESLKYLALSVHDEVKFRKALRTHSNYITCCFNYIHIERSQICLTAPYFACSVLLVGVCNPVNDRINVFSKTKTFGLANS